MVDRTLDNSVPEETLRTILTSQYHAALAMLRQSIELCPDELWSDTAHTNQFWRIAYHVLYYTHLYIQPTVFTFTPWEHHQTGLQYMDDIKAPPEIEELVELPDRPAQTGVPYTKAELLTYWDICEGMIDASVDELNLLDPESGFSWYKLSKLEHQIISLRHIQHHTAQLMDRVRAATGSGIDWVGARRGSEPRAAG